MKRCRLVGAVERSSRRLFEAIEGLVVVDECPDLRQHAFQMVVRSVRFGVRHIAVDGEGAARARFACIQLSPVIARVVAFCGPQNAYDRERGGVRVPGFQRSRGIPPKGPIKCLRIVEVIVPAMGDDHEVGDSVTVRDFVHARHRLGVDQGAVLVESEPGKGRGADVHCDLPRRIEAPA